MKYVCSKHGKDVIVVYEAEIEDFITRKCPWCLNGEVDMVGFMQEVVDFLVGKIDKLRRRIQGGE